MRAERLWRYALVMLATVFALCAVPSAQRCVAATSGKRQFLLNPNFSTGSGNQPDDWRTEAWVEKPGATAYRWIHPGPGHPGELEIENLQPNDARWMQTLNLGPGWYHFTVDIRTADVPADRIGATLSVMPGDIMSTDVRHTSGWTPVGLYLLVGKRGADVNVALRLGGYGSLNIGRAFFRNASVVKLTKLPKGAYPVFDLEKIEKAMAPSPTGSPLSLVATFLGLALIAVWGWYALGKEPAKVSRAEARRTRNRESRR